MTNTTLRDLFMKKIIECGSCNLADTHCDYHKKSMKRISEYEKRIKSLHGRQDDPDAISEVQEQLNEFIRNAR